MVSEENRTPAVDVQTVHEYLLLENRQQLGRDASLPDAGLLIWHVDEHGSNDNDQMTPSQHFELSLEQADGRFDLELTTTNFGDGGDLFGSPATTFGELTVPNSNWRDGTRSVEREPRIAQVKHLTRNVLDNLAEEEADAQAEIALGKHSEITIRLRRATRRCQPA